SYDHNLCVILESHGSIHFPFPDLPPPVTPIAPIWTFFPPCWTDWFDIDDPTGPDPFKEGEGDWETLDQLRKEYPGKICETPFEIEVQTTKGEPVSSTGDVFFLYDKDKGFACRNSDQAKPCQCCDYRVRFLCQFSFCHDPRTPKTITSRVKRTTQPFGCWTDWFDRDNPSGKGDFEILKHLRKENPGKICNNPLQIEVLTIGGQPLSSTGDFIDTSDTEKGFICKNSDQKKGRCSDYKVRFHCPIDFCAPPPGCWTDWFDRDNPSGTGDFEILRKLHKENPGKICNNPLQIQVLTKGGQPVSSTGDIID
uniref:Si:dkey-205h13.2 n=1 Tax=Neogobius melanostomus TaxID=47308 RepID=A0A8C6WQ44_9GOBI